MIRHALTALACAAALPVLAGEPLPRDEIRVHTGPRPRLDAEIRIARRPQPRVVFVPASGRLGPDPVAVVRGSDAAAPATSGDLQAAMRTLCGPAADPGAAIAWQALLPLDDTESGTALP